MIQQITTIEDVITLLQEIKSEVEGRLDFHPLTDFSRYINPETNEPFYMPEEAAFKNKLIGDCFEICAIQGGDFFEVAENVFSNSMQE